jgi:HSP20 family protein
MEDLIMSLVRFENQTPSLFSRFFDDNMFDWANRNFSDTNTTLPSVNIKENNEQFTVEVAAPGFEKTDFNIELNNNVLTISSEKKVEKETENDEHFTKQEFSYQSFSRSFTLPLTVERDKISAKYDNGILNIEIPKRDEAKPKPKKIISIS